MEINKKELDYLTILKALEQIPFNVGKKLLIDFLQGNLNNESIKRNNLDGLETFGSLVYEKNEISDMIENLLMNDMIVYASVKGNKFWKVLTVTSKGKKEIENPTLYMKKLSFNFKVRETEINEEDKKLFANFEFFLKGYNDNQKKAITCNKEKILCIAGAGSGKTLVLTKRIEFLTQFKSINPEKILAITFTRRARADMESRLRYCDGVLIETFNSFCEKMLKKYNNIAYNKPVRVIKYEERIRALKLALASINMSIEQALNKYFSLTQQKGKTKEELANIFMNDCFSTIDYCKNKNLPLEDFSSEIYEEDAKMIYKICKFINNFMERNGLRDYADQVIDTLKLFQEHSIAIPTFDHILIDEYQDVNSTQQKLIDMLNSKNIFCVGDPRQSIFGWRGSNIRYILNFEESYTGCEVITLTKNYRSSSYIVDLINKSIKNMRLPDLLSSFNGKKDIKLLRFESEEAEFEFVIQCILDSSLPRNEIFVLARTNRQLKELSNIMKIRGIKHIVRSDELRKPVIAQEDDITLATIHSIKGLEAKMTFVIGCTSTNFPCRGSEHPVLEMVKTYEYDKEEEERRLFYVAMSRAKETLLLTYYGNNITSFINDDMKRSIEEQETEIKPLNTSLYKLSNISSSDIFKRLKEWRKEICKKERIAPYMVLHDKTLLEIVQKKPMTIEELNGIYGFGPVKIIKYGEDIINVVHF